MKRKFALSAFFGLLLFLAFLFFPRPESDSKQTEAKQEMALEFPELSDADYAWIASRIFQNETGGQTRLLTYWGEGEDFPSFGIGHFIWFPNGVDAPFDETFPAMASFVDGQGVQLPAWMRSLEPFDAPWASKQAFDNNWSTIEMTELRIWLEQSGHLQARFIVSAFEQRWQDVELPDEQKTRLTVLLQKLVASAGGLFAVIDYFNFKGLGDNPRERYQGEGWGLVQVLGAMQTPSPDGKDLVSNFRDAAANRLTMRVELSPPGRNEKRWLEGWLARLDGYDSKEGS